MKKLVSFMMVITILLSFNITAYAEEPSEQKPTAPLTGVIFSTEPDELTEEEQILVNLKIAQALALANTPTTKAATKISIPGTFTMYKQENDTYCVPACIKSVLKYITGVVYTQSKIAEDVETSIMGTYNSKIAPYLNKMQAKHFYSRSTKPSEPNMALFIYTTIAQNSLPALMCISTGSDWYYVTSGHCVVVNAIYSDRSRIQFADPLGGYLANVPVYYIKDSDDIHNVCVDLIW